MWDSRFFKTTRGKVLLHIKKQGMCTVTHLSRELGLTSNAIRQHLSALSRDNLVSQQPLKVGPSKPAQAYSLTPQAESLFPKRYDTMLLDVVRELIRNQGEDGARQWLGGVGHCSAGQFSERTARLTFDEKLAAVSQILEESGSIPQWERNGEHLALRDFNCPFSLVSREAPQMCEAQRSFLQRLLSPARVDAACDHLQGHCRFPVTPGAEDESDPKIDSPITPV